MASRADGLTVGVRALALAVDLRRLRRLRIAYRADPDVYPELLRLTTALILGAADGTKVAVTGGPGDCGGHLVTSEFAAAAGLSERAVRRACAERRLSAVKRGGHWWIDATALTMREVS
jgi:hypothetical protein